MRAASTACTVSGIAKPSSCSPTHPPVAPTRRGRRCRRAHRRALRGRTGCRPPARRGDREARPAAPPGASRRASCSARLRRTADRARGRSSCACRRPRSAGRRGSRGERSRASDERGAHVRDDALEEVEQIGLGPVDVLDEEHRRAAERRSPPRTRPPRRAAARARRAGGARERRRARGRARGSRGPRGARSSSSAVLPHEARSARARSRRAASR